MVQGKKQLNSKPKFAEVVIGDNEAKEMRESANARNRRNPFYDNFRFLSFFLVVSKKKRNFALEYERLI